MIYLSAAVSAQPTGPISVDARLSEFDSIPMVRSDIRVYIRDVKKMYADSAPGFLGYTRTGPRSFIPVFANPAIESSVSQSLGSLLRKRGILASDPAQATHRVDIEIQGVDMKEVGKFWQTVQMHLRVEAGIVSMADSTTTNRLKIETTSSRSGLDTTRRIQDVVQKAVESALRELIVGIAQN